MKLTMNIRQAVSRVGEIRKAVKILTEKDVFIGVPADGSARKEEGAPLSNADISYIHEFGTTDGTIPPRPHLIPGIEDIQEQAKEILADAAEKAMEGKPQAVERALNRIGFLGQSAVQDRFENNEWPPLKHPSKARRDKGRLNPLIDTGQLRKSHTYVIRPKVKGGLITPPGGNGHA